jgi:hypothetical protein
MTELSGLLTYFIIGIFYVVAAAYSATKTMERHEPAFNYWFYVFIFFSLYAILFIILMPKYRKLLSKQEIAKLMAIGFGYLVLIVPPFLWGEFGGLWNRMLWTLGSLVH